jgi:putative addiction module killer protein
MYTIKETDQFTSWLERLKDIKARRRILMRLRSAQLGSLGDVKRIDREIYEMRIYIRKRYRLYFTIAGMSLVMIICAGAKDSQNRDIKKSETNTETVGSGGIYK